MSTAFDLTGKTALVTGACGILGKHFCHGLARAGANVAVCDLHEEACADFAAELAQEHSIESIGIGLDVTCKDSIEKALKAIVQKLGPIHVLHNNAASKGSNLKDFFTPFEDYSLDVWREIMAVNIDGVMLMAQAVGKHMIEYNIQGSIIQTASIYGIMGPDQRIYEGSEYMGMAINTPAVYSASKAAVVGLTKYLATYWGEKGIRVNTLTPGGVSSGQNDTFDQKYSARVPLGRMANAEEMVSSLVFLASDASSYITGQNIVIDGGLQAW